MKIEIGTLMTAVLATMVATAPAFADHNIPAKTLGNASMKLPLVRAYNECTVSNTTHNPPTGYPACAGGSFPGPKGTGLILGPKGAGTLTISRVTRHSSPDIKVVTRITDVRDSGAGTPLLGTTATPVTLFIFGIVRGTDNDCMVAGDCTISDTSLFGQATCINGLCKGTFFANDTFPGIVSAGKKANLEISNLEVDDTDTNPFLVPGLVIP